MENQKTKLEELQEANDILEEKNNELYKQINSLKNQQPRIDLCLSHLKELEEVANKKDNLFYTGQINIITIVKNYLKN